MKAVLKKFFNNIGYNVVKVHSADTRVQPYATFSKKHQNITSLERIADMSLSIPGMITPKSGQFLYSLCYMQEATGDVAEIGSWQGRSSSFLARAVKDSGNGIFCAIDHFRGNEGKETFYKVDGDLGSLKDNFIKNMKSMGLIDSVKLLDMENTEAAKEFQDKQIRFLFIDGDHTRPGVEKDIKLFLPKLKDNAIIVFDDYFDGFPGVIEATDELIDSVKPKKIFYYEHTLVIQL